MIRRIILRSQEIRDRAALAVASLPISEDAPLEILIHPHEPERTLDQNARMWAMLADLSDQVEWPVNGRMGLLAKEDWKDVLTAALEHDQRIAQGIEGGFVILGRRTSRMNKRRMSDLIELIRHFGDSRGVQWSEPMDAELEARTA